MGNNLSVNEDISEWVAATRAQGDPSKYSKTDLEIWIMRLFDNFNFKAGKSNKEKRRSFEEIWEVSDGNSKAIASGFNAALKAEIYSLAYVKACVKWIDISPPAVPPLAAPHKPCQLNVLKIKSTPKTPVRTPRKKKEPVIAEPTPDVEWK